MLHSKRYGYCAVVIPTASELFAAADQFLFQRVLRNENHLSDRFSLRKPIIVTTCHAANMTDSCHENLYTLTTLYLWLKCCSKSHIDLNFFKFTLLIIVHLCCYAELAVSFLAVAETIAGTHCAYPRRDGQAELAWVAGYIPRCYAHPTTVTHPNRANAVTATPNCTMLMTPHECNWRKFHISKNTDRLLWQFSTPRVVGQFFTATN